MSITPSAALETSTLACVHQAHFHLGAALRHIAATLDDPTVWHGLTTELSQLHRLSRALRPDTPALADSLRELITELTTLVTPLESEVVDTWMEGYRHGFHDGQAQPRTRNKRKENGS
jgi:hypothetical protein